MKASPKIIAVAVMILIFSVTVAAAAGSDSFDGFGVTLAELFSWDKPLAGENAIETDTDCRETDSDCESWTDAPPYFVSGQCGDNLYWSLDTGEKVLRISGTGAMYDYSPIKEAPWYEHRRYIKSIGIESGATSIGSYAFEDCPRLQSINIPEGVESIGAYAFWDCIKLESIAIPDSVTSVGNRAFYGCSGLQKAEIGSGLKKIPDYMFSGCTKLYDVTIAEGVEEIGDGAFYSCFSYYYYYYGHSTDITIPESVKSIGNSAFYGCTDLNKITLGNSVEIIGDYAFYNCGVQNITIPDSVKNIGAEAFASSSLINVSIGNGVTSIGNYTFRNCYNLQSIVIPDSVTSIKNSAFYGCDSLQSVTFGNGVRSIGSYAFAACDSIKNIILPNSVETVYRGAFDNCDSLRYVHIPAYVTNIGNNTWGETENILNSTSAVICSNIENCYAKEYADAYGIEFFVCGEDHTPYIDNIGGQCGDNLYWSLDFTTGVLTISGEGEMYEYAPDAPLDESELTMPWYPYKRYISSIELSDNITSITNFAFFNIDNLNCVVLPNSIEYIGHDVFSNCDSLRYVHIPSNISYIDGNILIYTFAVICSNTEDCYAKEYADKFGIDFLVCGEEHTPMPDNIEKYHCESCDQNFWDIDSYENHMNNHYYCERCGLSFDDYYSYKKHINMHYNEIPETDAGADVATEPATMPSVQLPDALKPTQPTTAVTWYYCSYCDKGFPSSSSLSNHINVYHCATEIPGTDTENSNICPYCGTMFDSVEAVDDHKTHCSKRPKIICPYCNISFVDETIYYNHINNCTTGNKYADMSFKEIIDKLIAVLESQSGQWNDIESIITKLIDLYHDGASALTEAEAKELVADLEIILGDSELLAVFKERLNDLYSGDIQAGTTTTTAAYICDYCGLRFGGKEQLNHHVSICGKGNGQEISVKIKTPSVSSVSYGDGIILHAEVSPLPEGMKYEWRASNTCFDMNVSDGGAFCTVTPRENGSTVFSIVVTDAEGNVVCESEPVVLKAKASIFDRIIAFFRNLFGLTKILPEMMK